MEPGANTLSRVQPEPAYELARLYSEREWRGGGVGGGAVKGEARCSSIDTFSDGITKARLLPLPI